MNWDASNAKVETSWSCNIIMNIHHQSSQYIDLTLAHIVRIVQVSTAARICETGGERERREMASSQKGKKFLKNDVTHK